MATVITGSMPAIDGPLHGKSQHKAGRAPISHSTNPLHAKRFERGGGGGVPFRAGQAFTRSAEARVVTVQNPLNPLRRSVSAPLKRENPVVKSFDQIRAGLALLKRGDRRASRTFAEAIARNAGSIFDDPELIARLSSADAIDIMQSAIERTGSARLLDLARENAAKIEKLTPSKTKKRAKKVHTVATAIAAVCLVVTFSFPPAVVVTGPITLAAAVTSAVAKGYVQFAKKAERRERGMRAAKRVFNPLPPVIQAERDAKLLRLVR